MGHLISRAFRRLTQGGNNNNNNSNSSNNAQQQQASGQQTPTRNGQDQAEQSTQNNNGRRDQQQASQPELDKSKVQSIPVGQSIDSAEYSALAAVGQRTAPTTTTRRQDSSKENKPEQPTVNLENELEELDEKDKPQVEEAVIKIQALVRGHLARKALKDAQQQQPQPQQLGSSGQLDDQENLTRNRLISTNSSSSTSRSPNLESIAEDSEIGAPAQSTITTNTSHLDGDAHQQQRLKSPPLVDRVRQQADQESQSSHTTKTLTRTDSPCPSEANASIDLHCETPTSASIDILDHHLTGPSSTHLSGILSAATTTNNNNNNNQQPQQQPERIASVLHHRDVDRPQQLITISSSSNNNHHVAAADEQSSPAAAAELTINDSAELAAIRIQSAFRGYKTRKHSPYRRRGRVNELNGDSGGGDSENLSISSAPTTVDGAGLGSTSLVPNGAAAGEQQISKRARSLRQQDAQEEEDDEEDSDEGIGGEEKVPVGSRLVAAANDDGADRLEAADSTASAGRRASRPIKQDSTGTIKEVEATIRDTTGESVGGALVVDDDQQPSEARRESIPIAAQVLAATTTTTQEIEQPKTTEARPQNSIELDLTDSSNLGAALSFNLEDSSLAEDVSEVGQQQEQEESPAVDDKQAEGEEEEELTESIGANLVAADEPTAEQEQQEPEKKQTAGDSLEVVDLDDEPSELSPAALVDSILDEVQLEPKEEGAKDQVKAADETQQRQQQQLSIELESDDIERRDPRGQASEDRLESSKQTEQIEQQQQQTVEESAASGGGNLSPLSDNNSDIKSSSSEDGSVAADSSNEQQQSDNEEDGGANKKQPQQQQQQPTGGQKPAQKNKKQQQRQRNNNRKKGNKK